MKRRLQNAKQIAFAMLFFVVATVNSQTNCYLQIASSSSAALCPGSPVVLTATAAAVNVGTGVTGTLNVTGTVFTDGTKAAVVGANNTGVNSKVRVASVAGFSVGDEVLLITMQDPNTAASNLAGQYDFAVISSIAGDTLRFGSVLTKSYNASGSVIHQAIKVPHYTNITIATGGVLTCSNWNGATGGVLAFRASGVVTINSGGGINANGKGYRAPAQKASLWRNANGGQGEGIYGFGIGSGANGAGPCNNNAAWNNANGNGGGGGTGCGDSGGGGGGGYASAGNSGVNNGHTPGLGGNSIGNSSLTLLYMGGAGGEGGADEDGAFPGSGGNGGGVIMIAANSLVVNGMLQNNGANGNNGSNDTPGAGCGMTAGGAGAGGSTVLQINSFSGTAANITALGGTGGLSVGGCNGNLQTGGSGSNGRIKVEIPSGSVATNPAANVVTIPPVSGLSYAWSNAVTQQTNAINPSSSTVYNVTVKAGSGCVGSTASFTVAVLPSPTLSISGTNTLCAGGSLVLSGNGASSYTWTNNSSTSTTLSVNPTANTVYSLTGRSAQGCIGNTALQSISVFSVPVLAISGPTSICSGASALLSGSGAGTYTWSAPALNTATVSVAPTVATTYTLNGKSSDGCSANATTFAIAVNTVPVLSITGGNTLCAGSSVVLNANGASTYTWSAAAGNAATISINPSSNSTYSLTGTTAQGCTGNTATLAVTVYSLPVIAITGTNAICSGASAVLTAQGASSYTWTAPSSNNTTISINPTSATVYTLSGKTVQGCSGNTATLSVAVYSLPALSITGSNSLCAGSSLQLTANGAATYQWLNNSSTASSITVSPTANTVYSLTGLSSQGCSGTQVTSAVTVYTIPAVSISGSNTVCSGGSRVLTANGASTYTWVSQGSNSASFTVTPTTNTTYTLIGASAQGCLGNSAQLSVAVYSLPIIAITGTNAICAGASTGLTASGAATYTWLSGGSNSSSISINPSSLTTYSLAGTSAQGCAGNTATLAVAVNTLPVVSISGANTVCAGNPISFNAAGANAYLWLNNSSTSASQTTTPLSSTVYSVSGISSQGCSGNTATLAVTVLTVPVISISGTTDICAGSSAILTAAGADTYLWSDASSVNTITVSPNSTAIYSVAGASNNGCIAQAVSYTLAVNPNPTITIAGTQTICSGDNTILTATGADNYSWNTTATTNSIIVNPTSSTVYSVSASFTTGCSSTGDVTVTVNQLPLVVISGNAVICFGDSTELTASGAASYAWSSGSTSSVTTIAPAVSANYTVVGTDVNGCMNVSVSNVTVNALPSISISGNAAICAGDSLVLTAGGAASYTWSSGSTSNSIVVTPTNSVGYSIISIIAESTEGCISSTLDSVLVNAVPSITISGGNLVCTGNSLTITASGANSYSWNTGSTNSAISINPVNNTSYSVVGTSTDGCTSLSAHDVTVISVPVIAISGSTVMCMGDSVTLSVNGANTYTWSNGATGSSVVLYPTATTNYSVIGEVGVGCSDTTETTVKVNTLPVLVATAETATICLGESTIINVSGATTYTWNTGDNVSSIVVSPTVSTSYTVNGTSVDNCSSSTSIQLEVSECTGLSSVSKEPIISVYPNPVSSQLTLESGTTLKLEVEIFNTIGQKVMVETMQGKGILNLNQLTNGLYIVKLKLENGSTETKTIVKY